MTKLRISLFGGWHWAADGGALPPLSPPRLKSLAACLLLHEGAPLTRDQLAGRLWPGEAADAARANLRRHLHLLRQALPAGHGVTTQGETVRWANPEDTWLDVAELKRGCAAALAQPAPQPAEELLTLYPGDLLPEVYDEWLEAPREALRSQLLQTLSVVLERLAAAGETAAAIRLAQRILTLDPLREETHRALMRLLAASGDQQAALRQFDACEQLLADELGVAPMPETLTLRQQVLDAPPVTRPAGPPPPPPEERSLPAGIPPASPRRRAQWLRLWPLAAVFALLLSLIFLLLPGPPAPRLVSVISGAAFVEDTWIASAFPNDLYWPEDPERLPHERYTRAHLQYYGGEAQDRILLRFDLSSLPEGMEVFTAALEIHLDAWVELQASDTFTQAMPAQASIFQILTPWQAGQATYHQPWTAPGLQAGSDYVAEALDTQHLPGAAWLQFDITTAARAWLEQPDQNRGVMLMIVAASENKAHYWVDMTDQPSPALRPRLILTLR